MPPVPLDTADSANFYSREADRMVEENPNLRNLPEKYLIVVAHLLSGRLNATETFERLNEPILKQSIKSFCWLFIVQYSVLALFGIIFNVAIIIYVIRCKLYKDTTHAFIVNLALCYFVQCAFVLPITLTVMLIQNWVFGQFLCFFLPLLQDIPLHVALISHLFMAWDRLRWLGDPLRTRVPAFVCCCTTWLAGMVIALPYPIYTTYLALGDYVPSLTRVGLCFVNLVDDMHEYMRGLFIMMYVAPCALLTYLYIRTAKELQPPDGPFAVMIFEHRANIRNRQRAFPGRKFKGDEISSTYDLYSAEMDVCIEKDKQKNLGAMALAQILCVCPLMVLRLAKMVLIETYDNAMHFDLTYLMFVWIAFLPTVIFPSIYASKMLPGPVKERALEYFRIVTKKQSSKTANETEEQVEMKTIGSRLASMSGGQKGDREVKETVTAMVGDVKGHFSAQVQIAPKELTVGMPRKVSNSTNISFSNITCSTTCNNGTEQDSTGSETMSLQSISKAEVHNVAASKGRPEHDEYSMIDMLEAACTSDFMQTVEVDENGWVKLKKHRRRRLPDLNQIAKTSKIPLSEDPYTITVDKCPVYIPLKSNSPYSHRSSFGSSKAPIKHCSYTQGSLSQSTLGRSRKASLQSTVDNECYYDQDLTTPGPQDRIARHPRRSSLSTTSSNWQRELSCISDELDLSEADYMDL